MEIRRAKYYKNLFLIAGLWNLGAGILCWVGSLFMTDVFANFFGISVPPSLFPFHAMFGLIISFGIGYIIVSRDTTKNHGIIIIGFLGKSLFFLDCTVTFLASEGNLVLALSGFVDLIFALLFLEFLLRNGKKNDYSAI